MDMVSTTQPDDSPSGTAHRARGLTGMWPRSAPGVSAPAAASVLARRHVRSVAMGAAAVMSVLLSVLLATHLHAAREGSPGMLGLKLNTVVGLGCLCAASWLMASRSRARRTIGLALAAIATLLG